MEYLSLSRYLQERFGEKLYRLALDGGMTCPNRDGTVGTGGCTFCLEGSGSFAEGLCGDINEQIERAKLRVRQKTGAERFIAYFQSFTNTYAPVERLEALFTPVIERDDIAVLDIATRPDCLGDDVVALLARLNDRKPVWVELGLQTVHQRTADLVNRCYDLACFDDAVRRLRAAGLEVIVHLILGLPGETREDMEASVRYVANCGVQGVKLQLLHILRGTPMAALWERGGVRVMELDEYCELVAHLLTLLPPDMVVHRLTGDGDKRYLLAPLWSGDKKRVLNALSRAVAAK